MASQGRLDGDVGSLLVADFANEDDIRILPDNGAQPPGKGQSGRGVDLDLVDPVKLVFHRVLDGDDLPVRRVDIVECGIERSRLAAAGRPGDKDDAVGLPDEPVELLQFAIGKAQGAEGKGNALLVEDTQHDGLAVHDWQGGYAQIDVLAGDLDLDTAVLRQPAFGNIELGHDLDAGCQSLQHALGQGIMLEKHAIGTKADLNTIREGFDVDVTGPGLDSPGQNLVDGLNDGGLGSEVFEFGNIVCRTTVWCRLFSR